MHILIVTPYYKPARIYGGPAFSIPQMCEALKHAGATVTVLTTNANGPREHLSVATAVPLEVDGVEVFYFPRRLLWRPNYFYSPDLARACSRLMRQCDVAYFSATWTYPLFAAARWAMKCKVPYVISPRGSYMRWAMRQGGWKKAGYFAAIERRFVNHAAAIHCTSYQEMEQTRHIVGSRTIRVIPNCVDLAGFAALPARGALRSALGLRPGDRLCLFVGRLHWEKRLDLIIECFAQVVGRSENVFLAIAGADYGELQHIRDMIERFKLGHRVFMLGLLGGLDLLQAYVDADMFVTLSGGENFGMACAEAMAAGLPVLISQHVGIAPEIKQASAGFVVSDEERDIVQAWTALLSCQESEHLGNNGRLLVERRFSFRSVGQQMMGLFRDVLQGSVTSDAVDSKVLAACVEHGAKK
jgi:glycosyltransferase involved in cell wall biosynthesis